MFSVHSHRDMTEPPTHLKSANTRKTRSGTENMETKRKLRMVSPSLGVLSNGIALIKQEENATVKKGETKISGKQMLNSPREIAD